MADNRKQKKQLKILIADDNEGVRKFLSLMLAEEGFTLQEAATGKEALEKIKQDMPDIILLDCKMPVMDGFETYARLKQNPETRSIPVIFCTSMPARDIKERIYEADDYIEKPFSMEELMRKISTVLKDAI